MKMVMLTRLANGCVHYDRPCTKQNPSFSERGGKGSFHGQNRIMLSLDVYYCNMRILYLETFCEIVKYSIIVTGK